MLTNATFQYIGIVMIQEATDEQLFRQFKAGDDQAFHELFRRYEKLLIRYIFSRCSDLALSKDVCQETFLTLINRPPRLFFGGKIKPWLFRVDRNKMIDQKRQRATEYELKVEPVNPEHCPGPAEKLAVDDDFKRIIDLVDRLTVEYREVVNLHIFGELTFNEVAKVMKIPLGTALWRMQRALSLLREKMVEKK